VSTPIDARYVSAGPRSLRTGLIPICPGAVGVIAGARATTDAAVPLAVSATRTTRIAPSMYDCRMLNSFLREGKEGVAKQADGYRLNRSGRADRLHLGIIKAPTKTNGPCLFVLEFCML
jgi:hypothetical protein